MSESLSNIDNAGKSVPVYKGINDDNLCSTEVKRL